MFLISLFNVLYVFLCLLTILLILVQRGKGSLGLGSMGGAQRTLFGGSGGQNIFQKITWILCGFLLASSLGLAIVKARYAKSMSSGYFHKMSDPVSESDTLPEDVV